MDRAEAMSIQRLVKNMVAKRYSVDGWPCCILCG